MLTIHTRPPDPASFAWLIKNELSLIDTIVSVEKDQVFIAVASGEIIAIIESGIYLLTDVLTSLNKKAEDPISLYGFTTKIFGRLGWGTATPLQILDKNNMPVKIKGHGTFGFTLWNPKTVWRVFGGVNDKLAASEIQMRCKHIILPTLQRECQEGILGKSIDDNDVLALPVEFRTRLREKIKDQMHTIGLDLTQFEIINLSTE